MRLAYRDVAAGAAGRPAVALHHRGASSVDDVVALAQAGGAVGRVVAPFGDYGFTASGMELAGICWYRTVPGYGPADPLTLAKAVVQVADLLDELDLDGPAILGRGEGAVVALGAALLRPDRVVSVVCVDTPPSHVEALPAALRSPGRGAPPVLLMSSDVAEDADLDPVGDRLAGRGVATSRWPEPGGGGDEDRPEDEDRDKAAAERIGRWLEDG